MSVLKKAVKVFVVAYAVLSASDARALVTITEPAEGRVYLGTTASVVVRLEHTPGYEVGLWFETRPLFIPGVTPPGAWEHESVQVLNKQEVAPGKTHVTVLIPKAGNWRMRATQQPPQAPAPGVSGPLRSFILLVPGQESAGAFVRADPANYSGYCPVSVQFVGVVGSAVSGDVDYQFIRSWGSGPTPPEKLKFDAAGVQSVNIPVQLDPQKSPSAPASGWVALRLTYQDQLGAVKEVVSNHADFKIICLIPIDPNLAKQLADTFSHWKQLAKLSSPPQACPPCVSSYNRIAAIDEQSLPLLQEGDGILKKSSARAPDEAGVRRLNLIKSRLDANLLQREKLVDAYGSQLASFESDRKRRVNPGEPKRLVPQSPPAEGRTVR